MNRLFLLVFFLSVFLCVKSQDVYVYNTGNYVPVSKMEMVSCIVFGNTGITVKAENGTNCEVSYEDFNYFRFYATPVPMSIKTVTAEETWIEMQGRRLDVKMKETISLVEMISLTGKIIRSYQPQSFNFNRNVDVSAGVYFVRVVSGGKNYMKKVIIQ